MDGRDVETVRKSWAGLKKRIVKQLNDSGFLKQGDGYWKVSDDGDAFAGVTFGATVGRAKTDRLDISFRILGGRREFHSLAGERFGATFKPSIEASQFSGYIVDGQHGKRWSLLPSTSVDEAFADISQRLSAEGLPKAASILDRKLLLIALESFELTIADGALQYGDAIRLLQTFPKDR